MRPDLVFGSHDNNQCKAEIQTGLGSAKKYVAGQISNFRVKRDNTIVIFQVFNQIIFLWKTILILPNSGRVN